MSTIMQLIPENEELVNYLYSHRLAAVDEQGDTVLHKIALYTTGERLFKLIRCLQTAGVDINAINREGHTALGLAISMLQASYLFSAPNSIKYILALLKCGANPTIFSGTAQLPLHVLLQTDVAESVYPLFAKLFHRLVRFQGADMTALELYLQNDTLEYLDSEADHSILESLSGWDFALQVKAIILADKYPHRPFSDILKCKITM
jgi:ankyrin repeat protein